jgi:hypothetical protein
MEAINRTAQTAIKGTGVIFLLAAGSSRTHQAGVDNIE